MNWPRRSIEHTPREQFKPPHCPWPECTQHLSGPDSQFLYKRNGSYRRKCDGRIVPRFLCKACGRGFSLQTFSCSYYSKRPDLLIRAAAGINAGSAHRQIARSYNCSPSTITRIAARLGRHFMLVQALALNHISGIGDRALAQRLFPGRIRVPEAWMKVYRRLWDSDGEGQYTRHRLVNAY